MTPTPPLRFLPASSTRGVELRTKDPNNNSTSEPHKAPSKSPRHHSVLLSHRYSTPAVEGADNTHHRAAAADSTCRLAGDPGSRSHFAEDRIRTAVAVAAGRGSHTVVVVVAGDIRLGCRRFYCGFRSREQEAESVEMGSSRSVRGREGGMLAEDWPRCDREGHGQWLLSGVCS